MEPQGLAVVFVDDASGTPTDITSSLTAHTGPSSNRQSQDYFTMDSLNPKVSRGGKTGTLALTVLEEPGTNTPHALLADWFDDDVESDAARSIEVDVPDDDTGSYRYLAEYKPVGAVDFSTGSAGNTAPRTSTFNFSREGSLVRTVIA